MIAFNHNHRRRRIAHVTLGLNVGGQEKLLVEFARCADRLRYELRFLSLTERGPLADDIEQLGWPVTCLHDAGGLRPSLIWRIAQVLRNWDCDILHTHDDRPLLYGAFAGRLAGVPLHVHTKHYGQLPTTTAAQHFLCRAAAQLTDRFVCVSKQSAELTRETGVARRKLETIWNGIDVQRFAFAGPKLDGPIVTVARLSPEKNIPLLLRAVQLARSECPDLRLHIAGDGPCFQELSDLRSELGLDSCVTFLGRVTDVAGLLKRARFFVLPSLTEGVSLTLLEAMASGLPIVATNVGGNPEVVHQGETGVLVRSGDAPGMATEIVRLWTNDDDCRRMGQRGRRRVERYFDIRRMVKDYERMYG